MDRNFSQSLSYLPRYHSVSPARSPRRFSSVRSLSQPSQRIIYIEGERMKLSNSYFEPPPPPPKLLSTTTSPSKGKKIFIVNSKFNSPVYRLSKSNSWNDVNSSHLYSSLGSLCKNANNAAEKADVASAVSVGSASCDDIYHKGPYYPDASQSESGVSLGESDDGVEDDDDTASQISYGSSSAFFETTLDIESDRCESEYSGDRTLDSTDIDFYEGKTSPTAVGRGRGHGGKQHSDQGVISPITYAEARKIELMKSPSLELERAQSKFHSLKVAIPASDHEQRVRRDVLYSPVAQSTPLVSPRSFYGPKLSVKASWNADDPPDHVFTDSAVKPSAARSIFTFSLSDIDGKQDRTEASSCYSSFSEDNLSDILSPQSTPKKTKTLKKASERPLHKNTGSKLTLQKSQNDLNSRSRGVEGIPSTEVGSGLTPEMLGICIPPLDSVIAPEEKSGTDLSPGIVGRREGEEQWWAVYNIETATARQEAGEKSDEVDSSNSNIDARTEIKIVKPIKTGIPLISPGRHGQEKLMKQSFFPPQDDQDSARRKSPPLLSLSPSLMDRIKKKDEMSSEIRDENNLTSVEPFIDNCRSQGGQPKELVQGGKEDSINEDYLPLKDIPVKNSRLEFGGKECSPVRQVKGKDDRLDALSASWSSDRGDLSHSHQNTTLTTTDGTDEADTNNRHYPFGNLSITGHGQEEAETGREEEVEGSEKSEKNNPAVRQCGKTSGVNKQVAGREVEVEAEAGEISSSGCNDSLPAHTPLFQEENSAFESSAGTCVNQDCLSYSYNESVASGISTSVCSLNCQQSSVAFDSLCQKFEALTLSEADLDVTLVGEELKVLLPTSTCAAESEPSNENVNTDVGTGTRSVHGKQAPLDDTIDLSILSGNVGQEKIKPAAANMDYSSRSPFASFCCSDCRAADGDAAMNGKGCDCRKLPSIDPLPFVASSELAEKGNDEEEQHYDDVRRVRVIATAQLPVISTDVDSIHPHAEVYNESGDKILLAHSAIPFHLDDSRPDGERSLQLRCDEPDALLPEISRTNISQLEGVNAEWGDSHGQKADSLWQQEGFQADYCHGIRGVRDVDRSINSPTRAGRREDDVGIPHVTVKEESDAQKDEESRKAEGMRRRPVDISDDQGLLQQQQPQQPSPPSSPRPGGPRSLNESTANRPATTKVVKQIHRKTVEETVTIERSVVNPTYHCSRGDISEEHSIATGSGGTEGSVGVFDYITSTNRKETVIEEKVDVDYISTTFSLAPRADLCDVDSDGQQAVNVSSENDHSEFYKDHQTPESGHLGIEAVNFDSLFEPAVHKPALTNTSINSSADCPVQRQSTHHGESINEDLNILPFTRYNMRDFITANKYLESDPALIAKELTNGSTKAPLGNGTAVSVYPSTSRVGHQSALDNLHSQLSYITGCSTDGRDGGLSTTGVFPHQKTSRGHDPTKYRDHGEATSVSKQNLHNGSLLTSRVSGIAEHEDIKHIPLQHTTPPRGVSITNGSSRRGQLSSDKGGVTGALVKQESTTKTARNLETYDNDYDHISSDLPEPSSRAHVLPTQGHHPFSRSGHVKSSSLWTLPEETENVLEGLSPKLSPRRQFAFSGADSGRVSGVNSSFNSNGITDNNVNSFSKESEPMDVNENVFSTPRSLESVLREQRKRLSDSSELDESDGNYSSRSTTDSSSGHQSSSVEREVMPLSDVDMTTSRGLTAGKLNSQMTEVTASASLSPPDGISSFYDFVTGLEMGRFAFDTGNQSQTSGVERGRNQITLSATAPRQQQVHSVTVPSESKSSLGFSFNSSDISSSYPSSHVTPFGASGSVDSYGKQTSFPLITYSPPSLAASEDLLDSSYASSSFQCSNQDIQSEGSSRLHALDLDLSRISSCGSPAPSDFSEGSSYTCTGTAEIKKNLSVSFDDDYDMLPSPRFVPSSTPKETKLKSALKKPTPVDRSQGSAKHIEWVKQFDQIIEDFNNKTNPLGSNPDVSIVADGKSAESSVGRGSPSRDMYTLFTNDESEKKQNHVCIVNESQEMSSFRFKRFLKKSHTKRSSKGKRIVRFLSKLSCVSESVQQQSPDHNASCKKKAKLDGGQSYTTDSTLLPDLPGSTCTSTTSPQPITAQRKSPSTTNSTITTYVCDNSPTSSNHSLDSFHSRTDSAYSSVSESAVFGSPSSSSRNSSYQQSSFTPFSHHSLQEDSALSSVSDSTLTIEAPGGSSPCSPSRLTPKHPSEDQSGDMLSALSDVFHQLDMCEEQINQALLTRLRYGHQPATLTRKN